MLNLFAEVHCLSVLAVNVLVTNSPSSIDVTCPSTLNSLMDM